MTPAEKFRAMADDLASLSGAETIPYKKEEYEKLSKAYLRLAEQSENDVGWIDRH